MIRISTYKYVAIAFMALSFGSCKKAPTQGTDKAQIAPAATIFTATADASDAASKAAADQMKDMSLYLCRADKLANGLYAAYDPAKILTATRAAGADAQPLTFNPAQYYALNNTKTKMVGAYPLPTAAGGKWTWAIDGTIDVMTTTLRQGDMWTPMPNFVFEHRLSQVQFLPYVDDQSAKDAWGTISKIELLDQRVACAYDIANQEETGNVDFTGEFTSILDAKNLTAGVPAIGKAAAVRMGDPVMIESQGASYILKIRVTSSTAGQVTVLLAQPFVKGEAYNVFLKLANKEIIAQAAVAEWVVVESDDEFPRPAEAPPVAIGAVQWTTGNLAGVGNNVYIANKPETYGSFFKWGTARGYARISGTADGTWGTNTAGAATTPEASLTGNTGYDYVGLAGGDAPGDPCQKIGPDYKTPTQQQWIDLYASRGSVATNVLQTLNGVKGAFFGPGAEKISDAQTSVPKGMIFLAIAGLRNAGGTHIGGGVGGEYWSSSVSTNISCISFSLSAGSVTLSNVNRAMGLSMRCVFMPPPTTVTIAGTQWVTANLSGTPGTKVGEAGSVGLAIKPEDKGMFFKWGTEKVYGRTATDDDGIWGGLDNAGAAEAPTTTSTNELGYDYGIPSALTGGEAPGDPCQKIGLEYRTPTRQQWIDLYASRGSVPTNILQTLNGVKGAFFGPNAQGISVDQKSVPKGMIFLPAAGYRTGMLYEDELAGYYWSSSVKNDGWGVVDYAILFNAGAVNPNFSQARLSGYSVRCVIPPPPPTVTIAGTKWLCGNLTADAQGATTGFTVEPNPQDLGFFWKWGSIYAYNRVSGALPDGHWGAETTGAATQPTAQSSGYDYANASGVGVGGPAGDPCQVLGASYKTPTQTQWATLVNSGTSSWTTYQGQSGYFLGPKASTCTNTTIQPGCIFLPAAGYRHYNDGSLGRESSYGYYWSSSVTGSTSGWSCNFYSGGVYPDGNSRRGYGFSVRCVQE